MTASLGAAVLELGADDAQLKSQLSDTKGNVEGFVGKVEKAVTAFITSQVLQTVAKTYKELVAAGEEAAVTEAKVAGVIRATGNAAGYTVGELSNMADEFSRVTGFDDELILNAEAVLLTFRQIGKEVFPDTMAAALDMSAVLGQDLQSSVLQLGKALNDPVQGVTALRRVGVSFSEDQMAMIKSLMDTNDILGAQRVILDEVQAEFGGAAEEMEKASAGGKRLETAFGNLKEEIGRGMIPAQRDLNLLLADAIDHFTEARSAQNQWADAVRGAAKELGYENEALAVLERGWSDHFDLIRATAAETMRWNGLAEHWASQATSNAQALDVMNAELQQTSDYYKTLNSLTASIAQENEAYALSQENVRAKQVEIKNEIAGLLASGYSPLSQKVKDLQADYDALGLKYDENAAKHRDKTNKILYDLFMQKLAVDGITQDEYEMGLAAGEALGQIDQEAVNTAMAMDAVAQAVLNGKLQAQDMDAALRMMQSTGYSIDVVMNILTTGFAGNGNGLSYATGDLKYQNGYASGTDGWMQVPAGYGNDSYPIWLSSGELFAVIPSGQQAGGGAQPYQDMANMDLQGGAGGGGGGLQFVYSPMISTADEYEANRVLAPMIEKQWRELQKR